MIAAGACALLLLVLDETSVLSRVLQWQPLAALGRVTYGLYFFHEFVFQGLLDAFPGRPRTFWLLALLSLPLTIAIAFASFYGFEQPFLRWKAKLAPRIKQLAPIPVTR